MDVQGNARILIPVSDALIERIKDLKRSNGNGSAMGWAKVAADIEDWRWSFVMLSDIVRGRQVTVNVDVYKALDVPLPMQVLCIPENISVFGDVGLLEREDAERVRIVVMQSSEMIDYVMRHCPVCEAEFMVHDWETRKYCRQHDSRSAWYRSKTGREWRARND